LARLCGAQRRLSVSGLEAFGGRDEPARLRAVASDRRFREAVTWQNPAAFANAVVKVAEASPAKPSKARQREEIVASYWQRYCAKNDTIGFFGPLAWGLIETEGPPLRARSGAVEREREPPQQRLLTPNDNARIPRTLPPPMNTQTTERADKGICVAHEERLSVGERDQAGAGRSPRARAIAASIGSAARWIGIGGCAPQLSARPAPCTAASCSSVNACLKTSLAGGRGIAAAAGA
jgi:hypothetical protein